MTTELVLLLSLVALVALVTLAKVLPENFKDSSPRLGALVERDITIGRGFKRADTNRDIGIWRGPKR